MNTNRRWYDHMRTRRLVLHVNCVTGMVGSIKINNTCNPMSSARNSVFDHKFDLLFKQGNSKCSWLRAGLHHVAWSRTMVDGLFLWSDLMVQLPWSHFIKNHFTKFLGLSVGEIECGPRGMRMHQKVNVLIFFWYISRKGHFGKNKIKFDHSLVFVFSFPQKNSLKIHYNNISLPWALPLSY